MTKKYLFTCSCCGKVYNEMPLCFGTEYPYSYFSIPTEEIEERVELYESLCIIDKTHFFHRGRITIPIIDHDEDLLFNVWTSISKENFELRNSIWNDDKRKESGPYFGWLQTIVPTYGDTINIKTMAYENEPGSIPSISVIEDVHPLTFDQQNGITFEKAKKKVQMILAEWHKE